MVLSLYGGHLGDLARTYGSSEVVKEVLGDLKISDATLDVQSTQQVIK